MQPLTTARLDVVVCRSAGDEPVPATDEPSLTASVLRYFVRSGTVATGANDLDLSIDRFERYLRGAIAALLGQTFEYRAPVPEGRTLTKFESDMQKIWREIQYGSYRSEPPEETSAENAFCC